MKKNFVGKMLGIGMAAVLTVGMLPVNAVRADVSENTGEVYYGDVNNDGKVDAKDVTTLRRSLAGGWDVTINEEKADVNADGKVDAKDVTVLRRYLAGGWGVTLSKKPSVVTVYSTWNEYVQAGGVDEKIEFNDEGLKNIIISSIKNQGGTLKEEGAIWRSDVYELRYISDIGYSVKDLTGLGELVNLLHLNIYSSDVSDISELSNLVKLQDLMIQNTKVEDASPLKNLSELETLYFTGDTKLKNIEPLTGLKNLTALALYGCTQVSDITPVFNMDKLEALLISDTGVSSLAGIENLHELNNLSIYGLKNLDISFINSLPKLKSLSFDADSEKLIQICSKFDSLSSIELYCNDAEIDLSPLENLNSLDWLIVSNAKVVDLSVIGRLTGLNHLSMCDDGLMDISFVAPLINLTYLNVAENEIDDLTGISNLTNLERFVAFDNLISDISELRGLENLELIYIDQNRTLKSIAPIMSLPKLRELCICGTSVPAKEVKELKKTNTLVYVESDYSDVELGEDETEVVYPVPIDEEHFPDELFRNYILEEFDEDEDKMLSEEEAEEYSGICLGYGFNVQDLTGLQYFPKLTKLECNSNLLTSIDVSKNTALKRLFLLNNQLTELNLSANKDLTYLLCCSNQLTTIDLSSNSELVECYLYCNRLTSLDVSNNTKLKVLDCEGNHISQLNLANNKDLEGLDILENDIEGIDLSNNPKLKEVVCDEDTVLLRKVELSQDTVEDDSFRDYLCQFDKDADGYLTEEEITAVKDIDISGENIKSIRGIEMFRHLDSFNCSNTLLTSLRFYDNFSENTVVRVDRIDASNNPRLEYFECWDMGVSELNVSMDTGLQTLHASYNNLSELDLSTNIALTWLSCFENNIETLDLRGNINLKEENVNADPDVTLLMAQDGEVIPFVEINSTTFPDDIFRQFVETYYDENEDGVLSAAEVLKVTYLGCGPSTYAYDQLGINREDYGEDEDSYAQALDSAEYNYYLAGNGIRSLKGIEYFPMVEDMICWYNQIEELDLSANPNLVNLTCSCNALNNLNISRNSDLEYLNCENNNLTVLDISNNAVMKILRCKNNNITELILGNNALLEYLDAGNNPMTNIDLTGTNVINGGINLPEGTVAIYGNNEMTFGAMGEIVRYVVKDEKGNVIGELCDIIYEDGLMVSATQKYPDGRANIYSFTYYSNGKYKKESVIYSDGSIEESNYREDGSLLSEIYVGEDGFFEETTYDCNENEQTFVRKDADGKTIKSKTWEYILDDEGNITMYITTEYDENGLKVKEQGWSYESDNLLWTKTEWP